MSIRKDHPMKPMALWKHLIAYITLGLLCGWYYFLMILYPLLVIGTLRGSYFAGTILLSFLTLQFIPLRFEPWEEFKYCFIWDIWKEYFEFSYDTSTFKCDTSKRYIFFEFPHGVFPMGQFLSSCIIRDITPGKIICGTGADVVFSVPVMRQIMAWIGTRPVKRETITRIFEEGHYVAIIPGGIAEMYLVSDEQEEIYFKKRVNTVKAAIKEGAIIVPTYFFGNTRLLDVVGNGKNGGESWIARLSRKLKASIMLFYGRDYLPVPYRYPLKMVTAEPVEVKQNNNPTEEEVQEVSERIIASLKKMYASESKPAWETRPLVIS